MSSVGDTPTGHCIQRLAARRDDVRRALAGRSLRVRIASDGHAEARVLLTRGGVVVAVPPAEDFEPQVEIVGPADEVRGFLTGTMSLRDAVLSGLVRVRLPEEEVSALVALRRLVAEVASPPG